jgi:DNA mismatch repair protein MutS
MRRAGPATPFRLKGEGSGPLPPVLQQYATFKESFPDYLLLSQTGGFFEAFGEDAETLARVINLALTEKSGKEFTTPMAGVPLHSLDAHIERLLKAGLRVAIAEQVAGSEGEGVMERAISQLITPGTVTDEHLLGAEANYLAAVSFAGEYALALLDVSTGEFSGATVETSAALLAEIQRFGPRELLLDAAIAGDQALREGLEGHGLALEPKRDFNQREAQALLSKQLGVVPERLTRPALARSAAMVLGYAMEAQQGALAHVTRFQPFEVADAMMLDAPALASLEIFTPSHAASGTGGRVRTLLEALDVTRTAPGKRLLRSWLQRPLLDHAQIERRLDAVELFAADTRLRSNVRTLLGRVQDLERLAARLGARKAGPRDLKALERTLAVVPEIQSAMTRHEAVHAWLLERRPLIDGLIATIAQAILDDAPVKPTQGGFIKDGYDEELDRLRRAGSDVEAWLGALEARERQATGIGSLKIGSNNAIGVFIEVGKSQQARVPAEYEPVQTLKDKLRYSRADLRAQDAERKLAGEAAQAREQELLKRLVEELVRHEANLRLLSKMLARIDVYASLAEVAVTHGYTRPQLGGDKLLVKGGRHAIVERHGTFMRNDLELGPDLTLIVLTGPNMSGKSTYLRQTALISIMAQCGSFVPAEMAHLPIFERVYTRIGASDDLAGGRSTFFVEAEELATILCTATPRSLVLLDEVGRGTSTYDGLAIATATCEYLHDKVGAFTLFATHYFELTELAEALGRAENYHVAAEELEDDLVFYHQVLPGPASRSYGVEVARLAGMPSSVVTRAREVLASLEKGRLEPLQRGGRYGA